MKLLQIILCFVLSSILSYPQLDLQPPPQPPPPQPLAEAFTQVESGATIWRECCIFIPDL